MNQTEHNELRRVVHEIARDLEVKVAFVCEVVDQRLETARTLALAVDGEVLENVSYRLVGTPCSRVYEDGELHVPEGVADRFPTDEMLSAWNAESYLGVGFFDADGRILGHVGVMDDQPLQDVVRSQEVLRAAAQLLGPEVERQKARRG